MLTENTASQSPSPMDPKERQHNKRIAEGFKNILAYPAMISDMLDVEMPEEVVEALDLSKLTEATSLEPVSPGCGGSLRSSWLVPYKHGQSSVLILLDVLPEVDPLAPVRALVRQAFALDPTLWEKFPASMPPLENGASIYIYTGPGEWTTNEMVEAVLAVFTARVTAHLIEETPDGRQVSVPLETNCDNEPPLEGTPGSLLLPTSNAETRRRALLAVRAMDSLSREDAELGLPDGLGELLAELREEVGSEEL